MNLNTKTSFPRDVRLVTKAEFKSLFDRSKKMTHRHCVVISKPNDKPYARLGVIVGKRTAKSAVTRNQIKRIMRESFRRHQHRLQALDIIIIARKPCETITKSKLREDIDLLWEKLLA